MRKILLILIITVFWAGCSSSPRYGAGQGPAGNSSSARPKGARKVIYGVSSYYGKDFHGKLTANGEIYDMYGLTAAHKTLPLNTVVRVTNLENDTSLILRINDRGPYVKGRILDCSYGAAVKLDFVNQGTTKVKIEIIEVGDNKYMKHD